MVVGPVGDADLPRVSPLTRARHRENPIPGGRRGTVISRAGAKRDLPDHARRFVLQVLGCDLVEECLRESSMRTPTAPDRDAGRVHGVPRHGRRSLGRPGCRACCLGSRFNAGSNPNAKKRMHWAAATTTATATATAPAKPQRQQQQEQQRNQQQEQQRLQQQQREQQQQQTRGPGVEAGAACCVTNRSTSTVAEGSDTAKSGSWSHLAISGVVG